MALTVNSNIASINAQRNLQRSTQALGKSLERLSSGLRINRAGDDAAGLAISENLRSQVRGLNVAVRNANDGISLVATAEGAIQEVTDMLQRMRELSIQAANDTNSANNRAALQLEVDQLNEEIARISATTQFNGRTLLDGTFTNMKLQVGAQANQTIDISMGDMRADKLGAAASVTSAAPTAALLSNDLILNGVNIGTTSSDANSYANKNFSSVAMAAAINNFTGQTSVTATADATVRTAPSAAVTAVTLNSTNSFLINGTAVPDVIVQNNDSDGALLSAINSISNLTGVTASLDTSSYLVLTASDGRNITLQTTDAGNNVAQHLGLQAGAGAMAQTTYTGTFTLTSDSVFSIAGNGPLKAGLTAGTVAVNYNTAVNTVDVTSHAGANSAISTIDYALRQINTNRAGLGAITNRLEMTISNLQTISENLSASDSRIRDADFAYETAQLAKNQVLQQAGTAILAQANLTPQAALQLLKG